MCHDVGFLFLVPWTRTSRRRPQAFTALQWMGSSWSKLPSPLTKAKWRWCPWGSWLVDVIPLKTLKKSKTKCCVLMTTSDYYKMRADERGNKWPRSLLLVPTSCGMNDILWWRIAMATIKCETAKGWQIRKDKHPADSTCFSTKFLFLCCVLQVPFVAGGECNATGWQSPHRDLGGRGLWQELPLLRPGKRIQFWIVS